MRRFKQSNKNMRFAKEIKEIAKKYGAKEFHTYSGYFIFSFSKHSVIHFVLPNSYKIGIWLDSKDIFAEHLANIDKFKPSATEFAEEFDDIEDIKDFIYRMSKVINEEKDNELEELTRGRLELDRSMYHYILGLEGVESILVRRDDSALTYNDWYNMDIYTKANNEDETNVILERTYDQIKSFYKQESQKYVYDEERCVFEIIVGVAKCDNVNWFWEE